MENKKEKSIEEQIKELTNALPKAYEGLAEAAWHMSEKYHHEEETIRYLKREDADPSGLVELISSYNPNLPKPFDD